MFEGQTVKYSRSLSSLVRMGLMLCWFFSAMACSGRESVDESQVVDALQQAINSIEDAAEESNSVFADQKIESHRYVFNQSIESAFQNLQTQIEIPPRGKELPCLIHHEGKVYQEGCRLIKEALLRVTEMRLYGSQIFKDLSWLKLDAATKNMAHSDSAAAQGRRKLLAAMNYYISKMQESSSRIAKRNLHVAVSVIVILIVMTFFSIRLMMQSQRRSQQLIEKEKSNREYTRKLELIGREVRRLRDLGAAVNAAAGILIFDQHHKVESVNEGFRELRGLNKEDIQGQTMAAILGLEDEHIVESIVEKVAEKEIWRGEVSGRKVDGTGIWMYILFYPELDDLEDVDGSLALILDITENKKAHITLERTRHLTALGEMAGGIAHEINNPLSVISGRASVLLKKAMAENFEPAFFQNGLEQIQRTVNRIAKIVDSMRRLSRADAGIAEQRPEKIDDILRETLEFTEDKLKKFNIKVTIQDVLCMSEAQVLSQGFGLSQILINLISNAVDAIELNHYPERWIHINLSRTADKMVCIKVIDPGHGIPKDTREKIMDPFFTTKPASKGTGLGLSLSLRIAEEHGGKIYYDEQAASTTFVLEIPELIKIQESNAEVA